MCLDHIYRNGFKEFEIKAGELVECPNCKSLWQFDGFSFNELSLSSILFENLISSIMGDSHEDY